MFFVKPVVPIIVCVLILSGCIAGKKVKVDSFESNALIQTAVNDFSMKKKLLGKNKVFIIWFYKGSADSNLKVIYISPNSKTIPFGKKTVVGGYGNAPSRYIEKNEKLFIWWDDRVPLSDSTLSVLKKYGLLEDDMDGVIQVGNLIDVDDTKGAQYYFCKNATKPSMRVKTSKMHSTFSISNCKCPG